MTDSERLTLEELAAAVHMTARNVRAYQTRGLLQRPRREGRSSVYGAEHVERLRQVQRARDRGASLRLLRSLLADGRDLGDVWPDARPAAGAPGPAAVSAGSGPVLTAQGVLEPPAAAVLAALVTEAARAVVDVAVAAAATVAAPARPAAADRLGELAGGLVEELVRGAVLAAPAP